MSPIVEDCLNRAEAYLMFVRTGSCDRALQIWPGDPEDFTPVTRAAAASCAAHILLSLKDKL